MNQGKYIFAQLIDFLPRRVFGRLVEKYSRNKKIRTDVLRKLVSGDTDYMALLPMDIVK